MKKYLVLITLFLSLFVQANVQNCIPNNNVRNPINAKSIQTISEADFKSAIKEVKDIYVPIFKEKYEADLVVEEKWEDSTVNAYAQQFGSKWQVSMFGGLARDPLITRDGFIGVICHEVGHHLGGAPLTSGWASDEGQADYYATSKCLKKVFEKQTVKNRRVFKKSDLTEDEKIAKASCEEVYKNANEQALCFRSALAGQSLARLLGKLGGTPDVKFGTPDPTVVKKTNHAHPKGQCRMDTYFQGALCDKDHNIWTSKTDASEGFCTSKDAYKIGLRPLCWFQPKDYGLDR